MADDPQFHEKASPAKLDQVLHESVQSRAHETNGAWFGVGAPGLNRLLFYRQKSDLDIPPYGYGGRGTALRRLLRITGAEIGAACQAIVNQKVQATAYEIDGPSRTVGLVQQLIDLADMGRGWLQFVSKWCTDFCSQDNGAFVELLGAGQPLKRFGTIIRHPDGMPVIDVAQPLEGRPLSIAHMDSVACERTGVFNLPVRYYDINGSMHLMHNTRVHWVADMPQPDERLFGYGLCALSRCISAVQYAVNLTSMRNESLDNMPPLSIATLENINLDQFQKQMAAYEAQRLAEASALPRGAGEEPVLRTLMWLVSQDPTKPTAVKLMPIRQLWESFDELKAFQWLVNVFAMGYGLDPQELAPLASTAMGSGAQSTVLDEKAKGKGVGNILTQLEAMMRGVIPASCTFHFDRQDDAEDQQKATIRETQARTVIWLYTGSTGRAGGSGGGQGDASATPQPTTSLLPGTDSPTPTSLIDRDEARRLLLHEIPDWADVLDPDMTLRQDVTVDDLDPDVDAAQTKMYGPKVRYHSKFRRTTYLQRMTYVTKEFATDGQRRWFFANHPELAVSSGMPSFSEGESRAQHVAKLSDFAENHSNHPVAAHMWDQGLVNYNNQGVVVVQPQAVKQAAKNFVAEYRDASLPKSYHTGPVADEYGISHDRAEIKINNEKAAEAHAILTAAHVGGVSLTDAQHSHLTTAAQGDYLSHKYRQYASRDNGTLMGASRGSRSHSGFVSAQAADLAAYRYEQANKAKRTPTEPISDAEIAEAKARLAAIGIDVDKLREVDHAST